MIVTAPQTAVATERGRFAFLAVLGIALALAGCMTLLARAFPGQPERAVMATGVLLGGLLAAAPGVYLLRLRAAARPGTAGLLFLAACGTLLLAVYFYWVSWYVTFPADILTWSEGDYVNDMIKFSVGYPLYSPQVNNDSFVYPPGSQLLTYLLAWLAGKVGSIPFYRLIQVAYTGAAAYVASLCCRRILKQTGEAETHPWLWNAFRFAVLLLIGGNFITNRFTYNLHGDALAQLVTLCGYYLLLVYMETRSRWALGAMALVAPAGFLVKQSLVIWAGFYCVFLAVFDRGTRPWRTAIRFGLATGALVAGVVGGCYLIWGAPFFYWCFRVLSAHAVSPLRSFQHVLDAWTYYAAGILGGAAVLWGRKSRPLAGAWLIGLALLAAETYTSGIAWMLNHMGPGCLIAGVWFLAGLTVVWHRANLDWITAAASAAAVALLFAGMGLVRIPTQPFSNDAYRYVRDIEAQFQGQPAKGVLLDAGSWIYSRERVVMGDRAPSIGERGFSQTGDFSGILRRLAQKRYTKILVRDFHEPDFWYETDVWPKPGGIRQALIDNYRETGRIRAAAPPVSSRDRAEDPYLFGEISILEPKPE